MSERIDIHKILSHLKDRRPVFHSEADFQFEFAWQIKQEQEYANYQIRLEYPVRLKYFGKTEKQQKGKNEYIDIVVITDKNEWIPIELKYKTKKHQFDFSTHKPEIEDVELTDQSATNHGRYWFWNDVSRIETLIEEGYRNKNWVEGYAIILTNDKNYWDKDGAGTSWKNFTLKKMPEKDEKKQLNWESTKRMRNYDKLCEDKPPLVIQHEYALEWQPYSNEGCKLQYLVLACIKVQNQ